jgi:hypothetical protein
MGAPSFVCEAAVLVCGRIERYTQYCAYLRVRPFFNSLTHLLKEVEDMGQELILAIVGGAVGLFTGVVTGWVNRRLLRDELAESNVIEMYLQRYSELGAEVALLTNEALQLVAQVVNIAQEQQVSGKSESEILEAVNAEFRPKSISILEKAMTLKRNYVLLPVPVIQALADFEDKIWRTFKNPTTEDLSKVSNILDASDTLLNAIRATTAEVMKRDKKLSEVMGGIPESGYGPSYIRNAVGSQGEDNLAQ